MQDLCGERQWVCEAMQRINADFNRSADTHLIRLDLPGFEAYDIFSPDKLNIIIPPESVYSNQEIPDMVSNICWLE